MTTSLMATLKRASVVALVVGGLATAGSAKAQIVIYPPAAYLATATPVFYEGHAAYWYGNRWYYRDGRGWQAYRDEPAYLHEYRGHHEVERRYYDGRRGHRR